MAVERRAFPRLRFCAFFLKPPRRRGFLQLFPQVAANWLPPIDRASRLGIHCCRINYARVTTSRLDLTDVADVAMERKR
jgi:hypothetical protein